MRKLLILGGTTEASSLAEALAVDPGFDTLLSFAGATRAPRPPPVPHRIGGFGGAEGLADFLRATATDLLIDATHPFAARISRNAAAAAARTGLPLLAIRRPPWQRAPGDRWTETPDMPAAAQTLGLAPRRVLLTIGQKDLAAFQAAPQHHYVIRSVDPPSPESLPPQATVITARGPFRLNDETDLLRHHAIGVLVTKNAGGSATEAKLAAARALQIDVIMIARPPPQPGVETVGTAAQALAWLAAHRATDRGV